MKRLIVVCVTVMLFSSGHIRAGTYITFDYPEALNTHASGISGDKIVGTSANGMGTTWGFIYNGINWTQLRVPGSSDTSATGISGSNIVGVYDTSTYPGATYGFLYNITSETWTIFDKPISCIGGNYLASGKQIYNISTDTWTILDALPGDITGISGNNLVGTYSHNDGLGHGFLYNMTTNTWTTLDMPDVMATGITGIDGSNIIGSYKDLSGPWHNFLYDGATWLNLEDMPGWPGLVFLNGIDGNKIVGETNSGHGFIYEIPEPTTLLLLGLGAITLRRKR